MINFDENNVIREGKTKIIGLADENKVYIQSKDDITARDREIKEVMSGNAVTANKTACNVFELLESRGIKTHYIHKVDDITFLARELIMIPLKFVVRRIATGNYLKRNPEVKEGENFKTLVFEVFEKDDANHNPMLHFDFKADTLYRYDAEKSGDDALINEELISSSQFSDISFEQMIEINYISNQIFIILEETWKELGGGTLFDFTIEFGIDSETGELLLGDVVNNNSWCIRFNGIQKDYDEIASLTDKFAITD